MLVGGIVGVRLITSFLDPATYGELALAMTIVGLISQVLMKPVAQSSLRYFSPAYNNDQLKTYLRSIVKILGILSVAVLMFAVIASALAMAAGYVTWPALLLLASIFAVVQGINSSLTGMQNAARHRVIVALHRSLFQWLRFLLAIIFIQIIGRSSIPAISGYIIAALLVFGSQFLFFRRRILNRASATPIKRSDPIQPKIDFSKNLVSYAWPLAVLGIFTWGQLATSRWALELFTGTYEVGLYSVLFQLGYYPLTLVTTVTAQLIAPILFGAAGLALSQVQRRRAHVSNVWVFGAMIALTLMMALFAFVFHDALFRLFAAPEYGTVSYLLAFMVIAGGVFSSAQIGSMIFMTDFNTKALLIPIVGSASLGILLNFVGARWLGLNGVVAANVAFSLIFLLWIGLSVRTTIRSTVISSPNMRSSLGTDVLKRLS